MTSQGVQSLLSIAGTAVLARILTPDDYGLVSMVTVVICFAGMFKDAGLSIATIQKAQICHEQISTLFWLNVFISSIIGLIVLAGSPLVSMFFGRPELTAVTEAMSISFIISGLTIQHQALLRRHMKFGALAGVQIVSYVFYLIIAISMACTGWRYWALVGGAIAQALACTVLTLFFCPWIPGKMKKGTGVRDMLIFGGHLTGSNFVNYFSRNLDNILIGKYIGANALGLYARAYQLFMMPITQIRGPLDQVALPVLSSLGSQPDRFVKYYQRLLDILASLTMPLALYCAIESEFLITMLLGKQWLGAVPVFRLLAIAGTIQSSYTSAGLVTLSLGYSSRCFIGAFVCTIIYVSAFIAGLPFGIEGVAAAYVIANVGIFFPGLFFLLHKTPVTVSLFLKTLTTPLFVASVAAMSSVLIRSIIGKDSAMSHFVVLVVFFSVVLGSIAIRKSTREALELMIYRPAIEKGNT